jgi:L-amino acid N-acyltransferase
MMNNAINNNRLEQAVVTRQAAEMDLPSLLEIYNDAVLNTTATFDTSAQTIETRTNWIRTHVGRHPLIVAELGDKVVGYCSLSAYHERPAYSRTAELSIYVHKDFRRRGVAEQLMKEIISMAKDLDYHAILSCISSGSSASIQLHKKLGFQMVGCLKEVGFKFNSWQDVNFYEILLD